MIYKLYICLMVSQSFNMLVVTLKVHFCKLPFFSLKIIGLPEGDVTDVIENSFNNCFLLTRRINSL